MTTAFDLEVDHQAALAAFAEEIGETGPVTIAGLGTRGGPVPGVRTVMAPAGVIEHRPDEMTISCGAGTPVAELDEVLDAHGQCIVVPPSGTIGGALAVGRSGLRRLGYGPIRDCLLQTKYVSAQGEIVTAGGPTVKNVSGFDLCRLLVGAHGTLGFFGTVLLRTRPRARFEQWYETTGDPWEIVDHLYRPLSVLWDGATTWVLLAGNHRDVVDQASAARLASSDGPPELPSGGRWSVPPSQLRDLVGSGRFVAELGVGVVHHELPAPARPIDPVRADLNDRMKTRFDPTGRLNPGVDVLALDA